MDEALKKAIEDIIQGLEWQEGFTGQWDGKLLAESEESGLYEFCIKEECLSLSHLRALRDAYRKM